MKIFFIKNWRSISLVLIVIFTAFSVLFKFNQGINARGIVEPLDFIDIRSSISGQLKEFRVFENDDVEAGSIVAVLDEREIKNRVRNAHEELLASRAALSRAKAQHAMLKDSPKPEDVILAEQSVEQCRLKLSMQEKKLERIRELNSKNYSSAEDLEEAQMNFELAQSQYVEAKTRLDIIKKGPDSRELLMALSREQEALATLSKAEANLENLSEQLAQTELKTPRSGKVFWLIKREGHMVSPGEMVMAIAGGPKKLLRVWIAEKDAANARIGQKVFFTSSMYPDDDDSFEGSVICIKPQGESKKGQQHYELEVEITKEKQPLKMGSSAMAYIWTGRSTIFEIVRGKGKIFGNSEEWRYSETR